MPGSNNRLVLWGMRALVNAERDVVDLLSPLLLRVLADAEGLNASACAQALKIRFELDLPPAVVNLALQRLVHDEKIWEDDDSNVFDIRHDPSIPYADNERRVCGAITALKKRSGDQGHQPLAERLHQDSLALTERWWKAVSQGEEPPATGGPESGLNWARQLWREERDLYEDWLALLKTQMYATALFCPTLSPQPLQGFTCYLDPALIATPPALFQENLRFLKNAGANLVCLPPQEQNHGLSQYGIEVVQSKVEGQDLWHRLKPPSYPDDEQRALADHPHALARRSLLEQVYADRKHRGVVVNFGACESMLLSDDSFFVEALSNACYHADIRGLPLLLTLDDFVRFTWLRSPQRKPGALPEELLTTLTASLSAEDTAFWLTPKSDATSLAEEDALRGLRCRLKKEHIPKGLQWLSVENFKSIQQLTCLPWQPLTFLLGANGAGKSNLLDLFRLVRAQANKELREAVREQGCASADLFYRGPEVSDVFTARFQWGNIVYQLQGRYNPAQQDCPTVTEHAWLRESSWGLLTGMPADADRNPLARFQQVGGDWAYYHFCNTSLVAKVRREQDPDDNRLLDSNGGNLASFLYRMKSQSPDRYLRIIEVVRQVAPYFADLQLDPEDYGGKKRLQLYWTDKGGQTMTANMLSDGTLRFLCLTTALLQPNPPPLILLDEPEFGLHPQAIYVLSGLITFAIRHSQLLIASHSPRLVDELTPEQLVTVDQGPTGSTFCRRNRDELETWLSDFTLGRIWEKGVIRGGITHV